jgi:hypothetical protein
MVDRNSRWVDYSSSAPRPLAPGSRSIVTSSANHLYYDVIIEHNDTNNPTHAPSPAIFSETRAQPLIDNPKDYLMSVVRFSIPGQFIPIFIDAGYYLPGQPNLTFNTVTLSYGAQTIQTRLIYVPQDLTIPVPPDPRTSGPLQASQQIYWAIYSYQQFVDQINVALATSFAGLTSLPVDTPPLVAPYMIYDSSTSLFSIIVDQRLVTLGMTMYFNEILYSFFLPSFDVITHSYGSANGTDIQILLKNNYNNNYIPSPPVAGISFYQMIQERPSIDSFYAVKTIVFTINNVPIRVEQIGTNQSQQGSNNYFGQPASINNGFLPIMTDFVPALQNKAGDLLSTITYYPTAEYRLIDLIGTDPLTTINIQIYWSDNYLNLYPLMIYNHDVANIKIMFRNKNFYNSELM